MSDNKKNTVCIPVSGKNLSIMLSASWEDLQDFWQLPGMDREEKVFFIDSASNSLVLTRKIILFTLVDPKINVVDHQVTLSQIPQELVPLLVTGDFQPIISSGQLLFLTPKASPQGNKIVSFTSHQPAPADECTIEITYNIPTITWMFKYNIQEGKPTGRPEISLEISDNTPFPEGEPPADLTLAKMFAEPSFPYQRITHTRITDSAGSVLLFEKGRCVGIIRANQAQN